MHVPPIAYGPSRAHREARTRRLLEKIVFGLVGAALLSTFLFALVQINEAMKVLRADPVVTDVYFPNCAAARAAGVAPIYAGQPGYRPGLDADNDGIACEPYRKWGSNN
jgi:hypothetical protein